MKFFIDTEFIEGTQKTFWGGQSKPTIDLISIGIVAEDGRSYYAISKDFNLKEAWDRWQLKQKHQYEYPLPEYWLRNNVLKPIFDECNKLFMEDWKDQLKFNYTNMKWLLQRYGKINKEIAEEIKQFTYQPAHEIQTGYEPDSIEFYGYNSAYDWVVFIWFFGKLIDRPKGFPIYSHDLKQMMDEKAEKYVLNSIPKLTFKEVLGNMKNREDFPKQTNKHNAIADAEWNKQLYKFITQLP